MEVSRENSTALILLERRLSSRVWEAFVRVWAPVTATETFTSTCGNSPPSGSRNVYLDAKVVGTLTRTGSGRRLRFVLRGRRTYQDGPRTVTESLQGTFLPVAAQR
jgi:hypothetical protein